VVIATHDAELVAALADRTVVLGDGRAVELPRSSFRSPSNGLAHAAETVR
jgi:energy-coupling factor transporter ATP-binding protein EcfA2